MVTPVIPTQIPVPPQTQVQSTDTGIPDPSAAPPPTTTVDVDTAKTWAIPEGKILVDATSWESQRQKADSFRRIEEDPDLTQRILDYYRSKVMGKNPPPSQDASSKVATGKKEDVVDPRDLELQSLRKEFNESKVANEIARIKGEHPELNSHDWQNAVAQVINHATQNGQNIGLEQAYWIVKGQGKLSTNQPMLKTSEGGGVPQTTTSDSLNQSVADFNSKHVDDDFKAALDAAIGIAAQTASQ